MDINTVVLVIILVVIVYAIISHNQENMNNRSIRSLTDKTNAAAVFSPIFYQKRENHAKLRRYNEIKANQQERTLLWDGEQPQIDATRAVFAKSKE